MADPFGNASVGTLFDGKDVRWFDWSQNAMVDGPEDLRTLALPGEIDEVDAACVNPLSWDIVWLFRRSKVVDYSVSLRRCMRRGRPKGGSIVTEVVTEIKDHPVFGVLPPFLHTGISAAYLGDPKVDPSAAASLFVVGGGKLVSLTVSSLYRAWVGTTESNLPVSAADGVINGAGPRSGQLIALKNGDPRCTVLDARKQKTQADAASIFGGFRPKAAVPVRVGHVRWDVAKEAEAFGVPWREPPHTGSPRDRNVQAAPGGTSTHNEITEPPDVLHVWDARRGKATTSAGQTRAFLDGLDKGRQEAKAARAAELEKRNGDLYLRLTREDDVPDFLRHFVPVPIRGSVDHVQYEMVFFTSPDFLSVGSDSDWVRVPLSVPAGQWVLEDLKCFHPTKPMARAIYASTLPAQRIPYRTDWKQRAESSMGGMTSTEAFVKFHDAAEALVTDAPTGGGPRVRKPGHPLGMLTAGLMKDVIISSEQAMNYKGHPSDMVFFWGGVYATGGLAHGDDTGESFHPAYDHNEYAMGLHMCFEVIFFRKAGKAWEQKRLADVLANLTEGFVLRADSANGGPPDGFKPIARPRYNDKAFPKKPP